MEFGLWHMAALLCPGQGIALAKACNAAIVGEGANSVIPCRVRAERPASSMKELEAMFRVGFTENNGCGMPCTVINLS